MSENDFQKLILSQLAQVTAMQVETLQRVTAVETDGKYFKESLGSINLITQRVTVAEQSAKSAHHRVDGIYWGVAILVTILIAVEQAVVAIWAKLHGG